MLTITWVLAVGVGKVEEALPFFKVALEVNQTIAQFWLSYIDALVKLNQMPEAKAMFENAKRNGAEGDKFDQIENFSLSVLYQYLVSRATAKTIATFN